MSNIAERLGLENQEKDFKIGNSFSSNPETYFHTFRYDFKPKSVDTEKLATVDIGQGNQVTVTVPHVDKGSGSTHTVFKGSKKLCQKECVLIIDNRTGEITLEKLTNNVQLKKTRAEGSSKIKPNVLENSFKSKKLQPGKPNKSLWSSATASRCSPLPKSPNSQPSPPARVSPSVPCLVPADSKHSTASTQNAAIPAMSKADVDMDVPAVGVLSSSDLSSSSSECESSDEESFEAQPRPGSSKFLNGKQKSSIVKPFSPPAPHITPSMRNTSLQQLHNGNSRSKIVKSCSPTPPQASNKRSITPQLSFTNGFRNTFKPIKSSTSFKPITPNTSEMDQLYLTNGKSKSAKISSPVLRIAPYVTNVDQLHQDLQLSESDSD